MGQALYRKYRSTSLSEIVGQEHITTALQQAIDTDRVSHAYLFTGPRGIGKTSIARILAYAINDLPYSSDPHLDIIEIDAASNRRIDEIRDLRDKVYVAPTSATYKVYIIDEVHMLTREAFNALLKTLEEPPAHVVFILATTDAHKLPETIISRTQRYSFRPVDTPKVAEHLAFIAQQEKIDITADALELLARHGEGSFRDSISMLDQVSNQAAAITLDDVRQQLGIPPASAVVELLETLTGSDLAAPVTAVQALYDQGFRAVTIAEQLSSQLRQQLSRGLGSLSPAKTLHILEQLLNVGSSHNPERYLELTLMQAIVPASSETVVAGVVAKPAAKAAKPPEPVITAKAAPVPETPTTAPEPVIASVAPVSSASLDDASWNEILNELKKQYNTIYGIVRMAHTDFSEPGRVTLSFAFAFHQKRITDPKNRTIVADTIAAITGQQVELICIVSKDPQPRPAASPVASQAAVVPDGALQDISSIFGGGELL